MKLTFCWQKIAALLLVLALGGCTTYHPIPLPGNAVRADSEPADMAKVSILASELNHPILRPIELNGYDGLSPEGAGVLAVLLNPSLRAARDKRALARAQLQEAGLLPNPELTYNLEEPTGGDREGKVDAFGLELNWNVASLISRAARVREAKSKVEVVDLDIAWREWQVAQGAKATVYQLASIQRQISLFKQMHRQLADLLSSVETAVLDGSMTAGDQNSVRTADASVYEHLLELEKQADQQRLTLQELMGLSSDTQVRLSENLRLPLRIDLPGVSLMDELEQRRLDLLALRRGYDSQEEAVHSAVLEQFPKISIGPTISRDTDNVRTTGFGLNIELPVLNRNQGNIAFQRATRKKLYDEYLSRVQEARSDIEKIESGIHFLNEQIAAARVADIQLSNLARNHRSALEEGRITALVYYSTLHELIDTQASIVEFQGQLAQAVVALELATGYYAIPGLGQSSIAMPTASKEVREP